VRESFFGMPRAAGGRGACAPRLLPGAAGKQAAAGPGDESSWIFKATLKSILWTKAVQSLFFS